MTQKIPPQTTWAALSINELYNVKSDLQTMYFNIRATGATYATQYASLLKQLESLIEQREFLERIEQEEADNKPDN